MNTKLTKVELIGYLLGHKEMVTSLVIGNIESSNDSEFLVSGSRDKTLLLWDLKEDKENTIGGISKKMLTGHNHFVTDLALTKDNKYLFSTSWDKSLRLWDLEKCITVKRFVSDQKEVNSVCFSIDSRIIYTAGMDKKIYLWNVNGEKKYTTSANNHTDWISKIRSSPSAKNPYIISVGWDGYIKLWNNQLKHINSFQCHNGPILCLDISQNAEKIATGGKDNIVVLHSYVYFGKKEYEFKMESPIKDVIFNPVFQWLGILCEEKLSIYELSSDPKKEIAVINVQTAEHNKKGKPKFNSFIWSNSGKKVYIGLDNGDIACYLIEE